MTVQVCPVCGHQMQQMVPREESPGVTVVGYRCEGCGIRATHRTTSKSYQHALRQAIRYLRMDVAASYRVCTKCGAYRPHGVMYQMYLGVRFCDADQPIARGYICEDCDDREPYPTIASPY